MDAFYFLRKGKLSVYLSVSAGIIDALYQIYGQSPLLLKI